MTFESFVSFVFTVLTFNRVIFEAVGLSYVRFDVKTYVTFVAFATMFRVLLCQIVSVAVKIKLYTLPCCMMSKPDAPRSVKLLVRFRLTLCRRVVILRSHILTI